MADYRTSKEPRFESKSIPGGRKLADGSVTDTPYSFNTEVANVFKELEELLLSKHKDYGPKNISQSPGGPLNGLRVRLWDKLARLNNLTDKKSLPQHESLEDTFKDMANYAVIGLLVLRDKWDK
jgi:hypothetical protein